MQVIPSSLCWSNIQSGATPSSPSRSPSWTEPPGVRAFFSTGPYCFFFLTASFRTLGTLKGMVVLKKWVRKLPSLSGVGDIEWDGVVFKCWLDWFFGLGWRIPLGKTLKRHIYLAKRNGGYFLVKDAQLAFCQFFFKQGEIETGHILSLF